MTKKQQIDDDLDLVEDDDLEDETEEVPPPPVPKKKVTRKTTVPKTRYAPVKAESGLEDVLKLKQDNLKGIALDNMTEIERRRWEQMNAPPEENPNNAILMAMAQNPQMFEGMDPNMRAMMLASMTSPQMAQMMPLMMFLKPQNQPANGQSQNMDMMQMFNLFQAFSKLTQPQLPPGPTPQQAALEDQIRRLEMQIRTQSANQKPQSDPMLMNLISQQQKNLELLAQKLDTLAPAAKDPLDAFSGMMNMFERFKGFVGAGPVSEQDIKLRQLEQNFKQREIEREYDLKKRALEAQAAAAKNNGMAQVIQNGINQFADKLAVPIANIFQQSMKEKLDKAEEPAILPISNIDENALNKLVTPRPMPNPTPLPTSNPLPTNPVMMPNPQLDMMRQTTSLPTPAPMDAIPPISPNPIEKKPIASSGIMPMYEYKP